MGPTSRVAIVQVYIPHYRDAFFSHLRQVLLQRGIALDLYAGDALPEDKRKGDGRSLPWSHHVRNRTVTLGSTRAIWQPCLESVQGYDLVIVEQASKLILNYLLMARQAVGRQRIALWGHGRSFQAANSTRIGEWLKRKMSVGVHWWFAYTSRGAEIVAQLGFPRDRITVVQNAFDTDELLTARRGSTAKSLTELKRRLLLGQNACVFVGGMYSEKRIRFLISAADHIRRSIPDFELVFIGGGSEEHIARNAAKESAWIRCTGPLFGKAKTDHLISSRLLLMPGLVGLAIVDSFAAEVPIVTTAIDYHSPEIEYLENGRNGVMVPEVDDPEAYARAVIEILRNDAIHADLCRGCRQSAERYTLASMVENFANGVESALAAADHSPT